MFIFVWFWQEVSGLGCKGLAGDWICRAFSAFSQCTCLTRAQADPTYIGFLPKPKISKNSRGWSVQMAASMKVVATDLYRIVNSSELDSLPRLPHINPVKLEPPHMVRNPTTNHEFRSCPTPPLWCWSAASVGSGVLVRQFSEQAGLSGRT